MQDLLQAVHHGLAFLEALADDHQLRVVRVLQLLVEGQVEADRALADVGTPVHQVRVVLDPRLEAVDHLARLLDRGVLRQVEVDEDFRAVRGREELVLHEALAEDRQGEQHHGADDGQPAVAHAPQQTMFEGPADTARLGLMGLELGAAENVHT